MNRFLVVLLIFAGILLLPPVFRQIIGRVPFVEVAKTDGKLTDMENRQLDIGLESVRLLITLATLLYGAIGLFIGGGGKVYMDLGNGQAHLMLASIVLAGLSIVLGQLSYEMMAWMLSAKFFNLDAPVVSWPRTLQYWSFMLSVACFGIFVVDKFRSGGQARC